MKSVIFDLDGTLADTSGDLIASANACFEDMGHGAMLDPIKDMATAFGGGRAMLRLGFSRLGDVDESEVDRFYPVLLDHYEAKLDVHTVLYDGVEAAMDELSARGYALGVCTNKPFYLADDLLHRLGIHGRFQSILGADSLPMRKPDPEHLLETIRRVGAVPAQSALIGDTITDAETCRASGVKGILVSFGPTGDAVKSLHHDALLDHYDALPDLMDRLIFG